MDHAHSTVRTVAMLGNHLPRRCGIATFTTDLGAALGAEFVDLDVFVLAMNDGGQRYAYPDRVRFEIAESDVTSYRRAAAFLNVNGVDVVSVQHEYGIFGGNCGAHVLALLRELRMPIVTTLHTILPAPSPIQRGVMAELLALSERVVVMSRRGAQLLSDIHDVPASKIDLIPHGIPHAPISGRSKYQLGVEGKDVLVTFGLLSPDKGIEHVIEALPQIAARFKDVLYIVLGATHPHIKERHGETYRLALETRAQSLGVDANIIFHDRFVAEAELREFLAAADIYITPYLKSEQSTSGTLAYALGAGKAVISTPYAYAQEMLAEGRGVLVPFADPGAIASAAIDLLSNEPKRLAFGVKAAAMAHDMAWPTVARSYQDSFERAHASHAERRRSVFQAKTLASRAQLPETNLEHVRAMTDSTGILQHAAFCIPRYEHGYCVDDNARALLLMALIEDQGTDDVKGTRALASRYLAFVSHSFNETSGRFRNFMTYTRHWTEEAGSEDSHGRTLWALGAVVGRSRDPGIQSLSGALFQRALHALAEFKSPRAWAFGLLGIHEYLYAFAGDSNVQALRRSLAERLLGLFQRSSSAQWPWFEEQATYENARLCQALLVAGTCMNHEEMTAAGLRSLEWLVSVQSPEGGYFAPIGSNGFYRKGESAAAFDQQPLDACATVSACLEARRATQDERWMQHARRAFGWFVGQNHLQKSLYDAATGGCRDGLHAERANENQGAESTLSFQLALLEMRDTELVPAVRLVARQSNR